jgi:hypothetical protein
MFILFDIFVVESERICMDHFSVLNILLNHKPGRKLLFGL